MHMLLLSRVSRVRLCATPWVAAHQAPPSLGFSRQEHWSGLPSPAPRRAGSSLRHKGCLWLRRAGRSRRDARASAAEHGLWGGGLPQTQAPGSRAQAPQLWSLGLVGPQHVGSSHIRDRARDPCTDRQIPIFSTARDVP